MGLRNVSFPGKEVEIPGGGAFTVWGVDEDMVLSIYHRHAGQLSGLFDTTVASMQGDRDALGNATDLLASLIGDAPEIMAELIAAASGSKVTDTHVNPDTRANPLGLTDWEADVAQARKLPFPVKLDALMKIGELTFSSSMPPGEFLAVVVRMAGKTTALLNPPKG